MSLEKAAHEILRYLFTEYLKGPTVLYSLTKVSKKYKIDALKLSDYLIENEFIRERWIYPDNSVACKITIRGIEEIAPAFVNSKLRQLIGGLGEAGGKKNLMEILEHKIEEYSIALDLVRQLESLNLVCTRHPQNGIEIELSDEGWRLYHNGSRTFFTLMAMA